MAQLTPEKRPVSSGSSPPLIAFGDALRVWIRVAIYSFGGPAGQIAVMHRIFVEEKRWISENRFLHALNYTMLLPGPEAQQLATYLGWLTHKTRGGIIAGTLFILPGFLSILALSVLYAFFQTTDLVAALFYGLKPAVMAIVVEAVIRIGRRALKSRVMVLIGVLAFIGIFFFDVPFPLIVLAAGITGWLGGRVWEDQFLVIKFREPGAEPAEDEALIGDSLVAHTRPTWGRAVRILAIFALLWFGPLALGALALGGANIFVREGLFFSQAAVVTFGGAYAVLAFIAQEAVQTYRWLLPGEMLDGLAMAETTPGPLIQVVQFVGFMGAFRHPGALSPLLAGLLGSLVTTWATFIPCFLWIFLGAPYIEHLRGQKSLSMALSAITSAVVGVILNLAIWFSLHTMFAVVDERYIGRLRLLIPDLATLDPAALVIAVGAFVAMLRLKWSMLTTLGASAVLGLVYYLIRFA